MQGNARPVRAARWGRLLRVARESPGRAGRQLVSPLPVDTFPEAELIEVATCAPALSCSMRTVPTRGSACAVKRFRCDRAGRASKSRAASFISPNA